LTDNEQCTNTGPRVQRNSKGTTPRSSFILETTLIVNLDILTMWSTGSILQIHHMEDHLGSCPGETCNKNDF